jgi:hypothetical protein
MMIFARADSPKAGSVVHSGNLFWHDHLAHAFAFKQAFAPK